MAISPKPSKRKVKPDPSQLELFGSELILHSEITEGAKQPLIFLHGLGLPVIGDP